MDTSVHQPAHEKDDGVAEYAMHHAQACVLVCVCTGTHAHVVGKLAMNEAAPP